MKKGYTVLEIQWKAMFFLFAAFVLFACNKDEGTPKPIEVTMGKLEMKEKEVKNRVSLSCQIVNDNAVVAPTIKEAGFILSATSGAEKDSEGTKVVLDTLISGKLLISKATIQAVISELPFNTRYYVRAFFAQNGQETKYSDEISFTTSGGDFWIDHETYSFSPVAFGVEVVAQGMYFTGIGKGNYWSAYNEWWRYGPTKMEWTKMAPFPGPEKYDAIAFSIGSVCYVTGGFGNGNETWAYDIDNNTWTKKADYPLELQRDAVAFIVNNKAYVGIGTDSKEIWEYCPNDSTIGMDLGGKPMGKWTKISVFPIKDNGNNNAFTIDNTGYVVNGKNGTIYQYLPEDSSWMGLGFPPYKEMVKYSFAIGKQIYVGTVNSEFWRYDLVTKDWKQLEDKAYVNFKGLNGRDVIGLGDRAYMQAFNKFYEYIPKD